MKSLLEILTSKPSVAIILRAVWPPVVVVPAGLLRHYTPIIAAVHAYAFDVVCYGEG